MWRSRGSLTVTSTASKMVSRAGTFLVVAPIIGPFWQGHLVLYSAWAALISLFTAYGFQVKVLREIPTVPSKAFSIVRTDLLSMACMTVPTCALAAVAGIWLVTDATAPSYILIVLSTLMSVLIDYISCALRGMDRFAVETKISVISAFLQFCLATLMATIYHNLLSVAVALFVSRLVIALLSIIVIGRQDIMYDTRTAPSSKSVRENLISSWPYLMDASLSVALTQIDVVMLGYLAEKRTVGIYGAGSRFVALFLSIPWMVTNIAVPKILRAPEAERSREVRNLYLIMGSVAVAGAGSFVVIAPFLTIPVLGIAFAPLNALWPFLGLLVLAKFFEQTLAMRMLIENRMAARVKVQSCALAAILITGVPMTMAFSATGLVCSLALTSFLTALIYRHLLSSVTRDMS